MRFVIIIIIIIIIIINDRQHHLLINYTILLTPGVSRIKTADCLVLLRLRVGTTENKETSGRLT